MRGPAQCPNQDCLADLRATRVDGEVGTRAVPRLDDTPHWTCPDCGHQLGRKVFETVAHCAMSALASRMASTGLCSSDPVAYADLRTSMSDWRVAFSLATRSTESVDRNGYRVAD